MKRDDFLSRYHSEGASGYELAFMGIDSPKRTAFVKMVEAECPKLPKNPPKVVLEIHHPDVLLQKAIDEILVGLGESLQESLPIKKNPS